MFHRIERTETRVGRSYKIFDSSRCFIRLLAMMCSQSLQQMQVREMGLQFLGSCLPPFLYTEHTLACFQSDGIFPENKDFFNMVVRIGLFRFCIL